MLRKKLFVPPEQKSILSSRLEHAAREHHGGHEVPRVLNSRDIRFSEHWFNALIKSPAKISLPPPPQLMQTSGISLSKLP